MGTCTPKEFTLAHAAIDKIKEKGLAVAANEMLPLVLDSVKNELIKEENEKLYYKSLDPVYTPIDDYMVLDYYRGNAGQLCISPQKMYRTEDGIYLTNYGSDKYVKLDNNFNIVGTYSQYNNYRYAVDMAVKGNMIITIYNNSIITAVENGVLKWKINRGNYGSGVNNPTGVDFLPNGNVVVTSKYGTSGSGTRNVGFLAEIDIATGAFVNALLSNVDNKITGADYGINNPEHVRVDGDYVYVVNDGSKAVDMFNYPAEGEFTFIRTFTKPSNASEMSINSIDVKDGTMAATLDSNMVILVDLQLGEIVWYSGMFRNENNSNVAPLPNTFNNPVGVSIIDADTLLVSNYRGNTVKKVYIKDYYDVVYDIPETSDIVYSNVPIVGNTAKVKIWDTPEPANIVYRNPICIEENN